MDNKDFDKIFSDGLQEEQDFGFQERDWKEVSAVIHAQPKRRIIWWQWLIPILLLAFGGLIYCLASDLKSARNEISVLHHDIDQLQILKQDTQYQKITIIEYDTIRKSIVEEQVVVKERIVYFDIPATKEFINVQKKSQSLGLGNVLESKTDDAFEVFSPVDLLEPISFKFEDELKPGKNDKEQFYKSEVAIFEKQPWYKNKLKIGITNAWGVSETSTNDFYERNPGDEVKKFMLDLGLQAEWAFNHRWSITGTITYDRIRLLSPTLSEQVLIRLDTFPVGANLLSSKTVQSAVHYKIGIKFFMKKHQQFLPYGGVYASAQSHLKQKISTNFSPSYQPAYFGETTLRKNKFRMNSLTQFFGYELEISDRISWQIEQWWRINLWKTDDQMYSTFGIRNTVLYHF